MKLFPPNYLRKAQRKPIIQIAPNIFYFSRFAVTGETFYELVRLPILKCEGNLIFTGNHPLSILDYHQPHIRLLDPITVEIFISGKARVERFSLKDNLPSPADICSQILPLLTHAKKFPHPDWFRCFACNTRGVQIEVLRRPGNSVGPHILKGFFFAGAIETAFEKGLTPDQAITLIRERFGAWPGVDAEKVIEEVVSIYSEFFL